MFYFTVYFHCVSYGNLLNTVVENLVDFNSKKEYHIEAKKAKDIAAGGVLPALFYSSHCNHYFAKMDSFLRREYDKTIQIRFVAIVVVVPHKSIYELCVIKKIAIMSDKAQTTRNKIQGVYTKDDAQIVFLDYSRIHRTKT